MTELTHPLASVPRDELVARAEADPHRPRFHFVSPAGWLNDPNGVCQWDGIYHLFYQYNPEGAFHHRIRWGHATSTNLVKWTDRPVALAPSDGPDGPDGPDADGCWSGVLVNDGGTPTLVYSGRHGDGELPCVATGTPDLLKWAKEPGNPVIAAPPAGVDVTAYRDHCVWREGSKWRQLVGSGIRGRGGTAFLYESEDLRSWDYIGPLFIGDASEGNPEDTDWTGTMWECVDLFRADGGAPVAGGSPGVGGSQASGDESHVLVFSAWNDGDTRHPLYWTGRYAEDRFEPARLHRLDYGGRFFYAPQSFQDDFGRRIMFGWLQEGRSEAATVEAGWSGVMSLPRVVTREDDGSLSFAPVPELEAVRRGHMRVEPWVLDGMFGGMFDGELDAANQVAANQAAAVVPGVSGNQLDLELELELDPGAIVRLGLLEARDGDAEVLEQTAVELARDGETDRGNLRLDRSRSSLDVDVDTEPKEGPLPMVGGRVALRILIDRSAVEIFANGKPLTARAYPRLGGGSVSLHTTEGAARVLRFDAWTMDGIFEGERTLFPSVDC